MDFEISVSDVVGLDGVLLHQQVVLQAVQQEQERKMLQYISECSEDGSSSLSASCDGSFGSSTASSGPSPVSLRSISVCQVVADQSPACKAAAEPCAASPTAARRHVMFSVPEDGQQADKQDQVSPSSRHTSFTSPNSRRALSREPSIGFGAFVPSFGCSPWLSFSRKGSVMRSGTLARSPPLEPAAHQQPSMARQPTSVYKRGAAPSFGHMGTSARLPTLRMSTLGRQASMSVQGGACSAVQHQTLTAAPSLSGTVGVVAMLQRAWQTAAQRTAADTAVLSTTLLSTGRAMEEAGGALTGAIVTLAELSTVVDAVAHTIHAAGAVEAAGALHTAVATASAAGAALAAAGGALQAVGRWGLLPAGLVDSSPEVVLETVDTLVESIDHMDEVTQCLGTVASVVGGMASSVAGPAGGHVAAAAAAAAAGAAGAAAASAVTSAALTAASAAGDAATAAAAASSFSGVLHAAGGLPIPGADSLVGTIKALKSATDIVPKAVSGLVDGLHNVADVMHAAGEVLASAEHENLQAVADSMQGAGSALRSAGRRIQRAQDAAGAAVATVTQRTTSELASAVDELSKGGEVSVDAVREAVRGVVADSMARLTSQLHMLAVASSHRLEACTLARVPAAAAQ